jgi:uncharacterized membrane protein YdjX (TVP38/TMEM64 family)
MTDAPNEPPAPSRHPWRWVVSAVILMGLIGLLWMFPVRDSLQSLLESIRELGLWGPVVFVAVYLLATVLLIPGSALTLGAGAVFGLGWGLLWVTLGANLGAQAAFLVGRYLARDWVVARVAGRPSFNAIDRAVGDEGWKIVGLTRLSPVFPFTFLNYAFGLTRVPFGPYALATFLGMIPGTVLYVYLGALANLGIRSEGRSPAQWALLIVGLVATLAVTIVVTRIARRALKQKVAGPEH